MGRQPFTNKRGKEMQAGIYNNLEFTELLLLVFNFSNQAICSYGTIYLQNKSQVSADLHRSTYVL